MWQIKCRMLTARIDTAFSLALADVDMLNKNRK